MTAGYHSSDLEERNSEAVEVVGSSPTGTTTYTRVYATCFTMHFPEEWTRLEVNMVDMSFFFEIAPHPMVETFSYSFLPEHDHVVTVAGGWSPARPFSNWEVAA